MLIDLKKMVAFFYDDMAFCPGRRQIDCDENKKLAQAEIDNLYEIREKYALLLEVCDYQFGSLTCVEGEDDCGEHIDQYVTDVWEELN